MEQEASTSLSETGATPDHGRVHKPDRMEQSVPSRHPVGQDLQLVDPMRVKVLAYVMTGTQRSLLRPAGDEDRVISELARHGAAASVEKSRSAPIGHR